MFLASKPPKHEQRGTNEQSVREKVVNLFISAESKQIWHGGGVRFVWAYLQPPVTFSSHDLTLGMFLIELNPGDLPDQNQEPTKTRTSFSIELEDDLRAKKRKS